MIVVDASCLVEILLRRPQRHVLAQELLTHDGALCAPSLIDVEVCHALRRYALAGDLSGPRGREAIDDLAAFPLQRYHHTLLLARVWQWRDNMTAYDAAYVALAEALDAPLATCDRKLAAAAQRRVRVHVH